jgi:hypothetical protein
LRVRLTTCSSSTDNFNSTRTKLLTYTTLLLSMNCSHSTTELFPLSLRRKSFSEAITKFGEAEIFILNSGFTGSSYSPIILSWQSFRN